jgi:transposase-like protein
MAKARRRAGEHESEILRALPEACRFEAAAVEFIEQLRWRGEPACPRCGDTSVYAMKDRQGNRNARFLWKCNGCKRQFTVRIGTIFEDSRIPMRIWCHGFWRACSSKKGVSALQISRECAISYKSALFLMHRIRYAMAPDAKRPPKLTDVVEADETFVGGKPRKGVHWTKRKQFSTKVPVLALVQRGGNVRVRPLDRVTKSNVRKALNGLVDRNALLYTDEAAHYKFLARPWKGGHASVNHSAGEYARGDVSTNTVESFFSILKRGLYGTYHSVSKRHLHRYLAEFEFKYNTRSLDDGERTARAIAQCEGKRLRYAS